jgi:hypothetical protein
MSKRSGKSKPTQGSETEPPYECHFEGCDTEEGKRLHCHGTPEMRRFWRKIDRNGPLPAEGTLAYGSGGCWVWLDPFGLNKYRYFQIGEKQVLVHRFAYEHFHGQIPLGFEVDHRCHTRSCVNPAHLEAVTRQENVSRSWDYRRYRKQHGLGLRMPWIGPDDPGVSGLAA